MKINKKNINWYLINANNLILGRLASKISYILQGKNKSCYNYNLNIGDYLIVINSDNLLFTGKKIYNKIYYKYTGYIGNMKKINLFNMFKKNSIFVLKHSIKGMLPKNKLSNKLINKIKIYKNEIIDNKYKNLKIIEIKLNNLYYEKI